MRERIILNKTNRSNVGSGLGVILYGMTLLLVLLFTAINIVNSKVIENGYNALRDAVQSAASGSVIHLLTTNRDGTTKAQKDVIKEANYDIYLQLALGYLINRAPEPSNDKDIIVQTGDINNFIKLDHQKVVNTTMALLDGVAQGDITDSNKYKVMMFFIEPYEKDNKKYFDIIAYGNDSQFYDKIDGTINITKQMAKCLVRIDEGNMVDVYENVQQAVNSIVNCTDPTMATYEGIYKRTTFDIKLNADGESLGKKIRAMETYPHYIIVVKDFALPTIFGGDTNRATSFVKTLFKNEDSTYSPTLKKPMCALNTGKVERQVEEAGWSQNR